MEKKKSHLEMYLWFKGIWCLWKAYGVKCIFLITLACITDGSFPVHFRRTHKERPEQSLVIIYKCNASRKYLRKNKQ